MKNKHKIFSNWNEEQRKLLLRDGIKVELGYDSFWIDEDEVFFRIKTYLEKWNVQDTAFSEFSNEELDKADWLIFNGVWSNGYPMPDSNNGYKKNTFDITNYCETCGIGLEQKDSFQLKKEPSWGNKKLFTLNWIYDELFIKTEFYDNTFLKRKIETLPVFLFNKASIITNTLQLKLPNADSGLKLDGYNYTVCTTCNRKRYDLINYGFFPSFEHEVPDSFSIFKSQEYFGTGANARKYIFLSQKVRQFFLANNIKLNCIPQH